MKKLGRKLLSSLLACLIVFTCVASVGTVTASASELSYADDVDYYGKNICDNMEKYLTNWCEDFFGSRLQVSQQAETIVFVDPQLLDYGFLDHLCQVLSNYFDNTLYWGDIYDETGILFLLDCGDGFYCDIEYWRCTGALRGYDFSTDDAVISFCNTYVGEINMCALGVWQLSDEYYHVLDIILNQWNDNFPIYFIYREPISLSDDGLLFLVYDSLEETYYYCYNAPGATY